MRERKRIGSLKREPVGGYFYWVDYVLERLCTKASLNEKVIARFMIEIPEISDEIINRTVEKYCEQKNR